MNSYLEHLKYDGLSGMFRQAVILMLLIFPMAIAANQTMIDSATIQLDKVTAGNMVTITPVVSDLPDGDYLYRMGLVKKGRSGNSSSNQSGRFTVSGDAPTKLSTTSINLSPSDICELTVTVLLEERPVLEKRFQCLP